MHLVLDTVQNKGSRLSWSHKCRWEGIEIERLNFHFSCAVTEILGGTFFSMFEGFGFLSSSSSCVSSKILLMRLCLF